MKTCKHCGTKYNQNAPEGHMCQEMMNNDLDTTDTTTVVRFEVSGGFDIGKNFKEVFSCDGEICGYELPDGRIVRLVVGLEVESKDGYHYKYITSENEMAKLGFEGLDYDEACFEVVD